MSDTGILKSRERVPLVDLFKGFAIIMVVMVHTEQMVPLPYKLDFLIKFGQMGCQIFFIMSAFSMCYNHSTGGVKKFVKKILPAYYTIVLLNLLLSLLSILMFGTNHFRTSDSVFDYIMNLLFIHGLIPTEANNNVVLGGWFIGTLIILYGIYPYIRKLYLKFNSRNRYYIFPLLLFGVTSLITITLDSLCDSIDFTNNSFLYFSFINQLPVFCLGLSLYDLLYEQKRVIRCPMEKGFVLLIISIILFHSSLDYIFVVVPFLFGWAVLYFYIYFCGVKINFRDSFSILLQKFSKISLQIYLTHSFIVYYLVAVIMTLLHSYVGVFESTLGNVITYIIMQVGVLCLTYWVGKVFSFYQKWADKKFSNLLK